MTRKECLDKAAECICGHREQDYGSPEDNFAVIAAYWDAYLTYIHDDGPINALDVANMMALFKIGRITSGTATDDSFVDACGYLACGAEIAEKAQLAEFAKELDETARMMGIPTHSKT